MHHNAFTIERLARELDKRIDGETLQDCFSSSKEDIFFVFDTLCLQIQFYKGEAFVFIKDLVSLPKRNLLRQFENLIGLDVSNVTSHDCDRSFHLEFSSNIELHFEFYGRHSRVVTSMDNEFVQFPIKTETKPIALQKQFVFNGEVAGLKFLTNEQKEILSSISNNNPSEKAWPIFRERLRNSDYEIDTSSDKPSIQYRSNSNRASFDFLDFYSTFSKKYISQIRSSEIKEQSIRELQRNLKKHKSRLNKTETFLKIGQKGLSYKEKADILMANLHRKAEGNKLEVFDFYNDEQIEIKLKQGLTIQDQAAIFYKKAKNQHLEQDQKAKLIANLTIKIQEINDRLEKINSADQFELKKLIKAPKVAEKSNKKSKYPFQTQEFQGFEIWIGSNSKQNDEIVKRASKEDTWLHIKDKAGSHVLIRRNAGKEPSPSCLEYAASLAAWHSKARKETIAAVLFTKRKYIRKFKGALPGQVKVDREDVLLVDPSFWKNS